MEIAEIAIVPAREEWAEELLALQRLCFHPEAALSGDFTIPPLTQTLEELVEDMRRKTVLALRVGDRLMGSVRAYLDGETCEIGRLMVHPELQGQGLGRRLMAEIETAFAAPGRRYHLFTGHLSARNLALYGKLGYLEYKRERYSPRLVVVFLEKFRPSSAAA